MNAHAHDHDMQHEPQAPSEDPASGHGMAIIGEMTVFLSHLPMFMSPHDYQVILQATFTNHGSDPQRVYAEDRKRHPHEKLYTLEPKRLVLPDLFSSGANRPPRLKSFSGNIYRGHFEKLAAADIEGAWIGRDVVVNVTNVVHARKFDLKGLDDLQYLLFGKGQELFLAHMITKPPDFDHLLSVQVVGQELSDEELRHGIPIKFPGRANAIEERIRENEASLSGVMEVAGKAVPGEIAPGVELFLDDEFLKSAM